jgi:hypothetical protein
MEILCVVILLIAMVIGWSETWEKKERYKRYIYGRLGLESLKVDTLFAEWGLIRPNTNLHE